MKTQMNDGTMAELTKSERYYCRRDGEFTRYYNLNKDYIPLAKSQCKECDQVLESKRCGDFVECECGKSFVDTDRWFPERHRYGGSAI